jgi:hypothetical protein
VFFIRLIDAEKKSSENNEEQRRPRVMLALQQCVMSMQVHAPILNRLPRLCSYTFAALFSRMVSFGILRSRKRKPRHESGGCIVARCGHHHTPLSRSSTHVGLLRPFRFLTLSHKLPHRFCDFLEVQGNVAAALDVHAASTRLCHSAVAWVHYLSFCRRAVSVGSFRYHRHMAQRAAPHTDTSRQSRVHRLQAQRRLHGARVGLRRESRVAHQPLLRRRSAAL